MESLIRKRVLPVCLFVLSVPACDREGAGIEPSSLDASSKLSIDWALHGNDSGEQRHSPLSRINVDNVGELSLAWYVDLPTQRGQEATPLVIDGVMYTTTAWSHVIALDAATGEMIWQFDPEVPKAYGVKACCDVVNRGVAYSDGRIFLGTLDGRLIALNAETGEVIWSVLTVDQSEHYTITGAPRVAAGNVFIGNGGAEFGVRGYISAYNAQTGEMRWRFYTVPGGPGDPVGTEPVEAQTKTWSGEWWNLGGGGTVWDSMAYEEETSTLYFGVGNGSPWNPNLRTAGEGDNWFLSSVVAVDAATGTYKWHYQTTPGEGWDFTATQHIVLADLKIDGRTRQVLMQAPKNGFFYVVDRHTGELISAEPFAAVTWASRIDLETGRPVINPEAVYWKTGVPALVAPSWMGAHNWHPMSYDASAGLMFLPVQETAFPYLADDEQTPTKLAVNLGTDMRIAALPDDPTVIEQVKEATSGRLIAWDPLTQEEVWRVEYPGAWNGGVLSTAGGLVFQGSATGFLNAYRSDDGSKLWEFQAQTGIVAPPVTYQIDGEQYIAVSAGWGGIFPLIAGPLTYDAAGGEPINRSRLLAFKLGGNAKLPPTNDVMRDLPDTSAYELDEDRVRSGFRIYDRFCAGCHGAGAVGGGVIPDLRYSPLLGDSRAWRKIVVQGLLDERGMIGFEEEISIDDAESIRMFVISRNRFARDIGDTQRLSR